jgi:ribose-phosphate pyrophosphokinase
MLVFDLDTDEPQGSPLGPALAQALGVPLAPHEARRFADGESKLRPLVDPRGADTVVVASLHGSPQTSAHDRLVHLLMFLATLREHGAARVTAVIPYLAYARKDRGTKPFDPIASRYMAQLIEAVGTDRVVVLEVHNLAALQNAFRIPTLHVPVHPIFDTVLEEWLDDAPLTVVSPDPGGVKRVQLWREHLEARLQRPVGFAMIDKRRSAGVVSSFDRVAGDVSGATSLVFDDLIASGDTVRRAAVALRAQGARRVLAFAAHGLFMPPAAELLADPALDAVVVSDSVPAFRVPSGSVLASRLRIVSAAQILAQALQEPRPGLHRSA